MIDDSVINKINQIEHCLQRIDEKYQPGLDLREDDDAQDIILLNLTRACEQTIKLALQIVRMKKLGIPNTYKDAFVLLEKVGIISSELSQRLQSMAGFRNIAIHAYQDLNIDILTAILEKELKVFPEFIKIILIEID